MTSIALASTKVVPASIIKVIAKKQVRRWPAQGLSLGEILQDRRACTSDRFTESKEQNLGNIYPHSFLFMYSIAFFYLNKYEVQPDSDYQTACHIVD